MEQSGERKLHSLSVRIFPSLTPSTTLFPSGIPFPPNPISLAVKTVSARQPSDPYPHTRDTFLLPESAKVASRDGCP
ncbi:hypothetical protein HPP92_002701 [Vanilla planifolia]|uniref:Uncharacterized protein n=1 Tax=Vanilla planifolia TaxID=51239 RepID=A0A835VI93_VANPL|nr:hypothetical protein HPP92_002701 [Vanilla planifolia]